MILTVTRHTSKRMSDPAVSKKRSLLEEWTCPVCLESIDDGCVPAVMNCKLFAHVICMKCATLMIERGGASCPQCREPFMNARPIEAFVNKDDPAVAETLKKKANSVQSIEQQVEALGISNAVIRERVLFSAKRAITELPTVELQGFSSCHFWSNHIPDFDKANAAMTVREACRKMHISPPKTATVQAAMVSMSAAIVPYLNRLPMFKEKKIRFEQSVTQTKRIRYLPLFMFRTTY